MSTERAKKLQKSDWAILHDWAEHVMVPAMTIRRAEIAMAASLTTLARSVTRVQYKAFHRNGRVLISSYRKSIIAKYRG